MGGAGQACFLRPLVPADAPAHAAAIAASLPELMAATAWAHPGYSLAQSMAWIDGCIRARSLGIAHDFAICEGRTGLLIGIAGLNRLDAAHGTANLGYWIDSRATGRGAATTAAGALARFGLLRLGLARIEIVVATANAASRRVAEKTGARFEGILRARLLIGGYRQDAALYSLVAADLAEPG